MARIVRIHHVAFAHGADSTPQRAFADVLGLEVCHAESFLSAYGRQAFKVDGKFKC